MIIDQQQMLSPRSSESQSKPNLLDNAVTNLQRNDRAVKLMRYLLNDEKIPVKSAVANIINKHRSRAALETTLRSYVQAYIGVTGKDSLPEAEWQHRVAAKQALYQETVIPYILESLQPIYAQVDSPVSSVVSEQRVENMPNRSSEIAKLQSAFEKFLTENSVDIENAEARGTSLTNEIYEKFYSQGDAKIQTLGPLMAKEIADRYRTSLERIQPVFDAINNQGIARIGEFGYWKGALIAGGKFANEQSVGRAYLNLNPLSAPRIFRQTIELLCRENIVAQVKIPLEMDVHAVNRADKMVVYFKDSDDSRILAILEKVHQQNPVAFLDGIPRFTAGIPNSSNEQMKGIAFGEDPISDDSFGIVRSQILAEMYNLAKHQGLRITDPRFPFEKHFRESCLKRGVNPDSVAFNASGKSGSFSTIRKRINSSQ